jgi:hypothetical protein
MLPPPCPAPSTYAPPVAAPPSYGQPPSYLAPLPPAPHAPRTAAILAIVLGSTLTLLFLVATALFFMTSR